MSYPEFTKSAANQSNRSAFHGSLSISSTGSTIPLPIKRFQNLLVMVRYSLPFSGFTITSESNSNLSFTFSASTEPNSGYRKFTSAIFPMGISHLFSSIMESAKIEANP